MGKHSRPRRYQLAASRRRKRVHRRSRRRQDVARNVGLGFSVGFISTAILLLPLWAGRQEPPHFSEPASAVMRTPPAAIAEPAPIQPPWPARDVAVLPPRSGGAAAPALTAEHHPFTLPTSRETVRRAPRHFSAPTKSHPREGLPTASGLVPSLTVTEHVGRHRAAVSKHARHEHSDHHHYSDRHDSDHSHHGSDHRDRPDGSD